MDDLEKMPMAAKQNTPASGAYGEKAAGERLKAQLPAMAGGGPQGPAGGGGPQVGAEPPVPIMPVPPGNSSPQQPEGVPQPLLAPTGRPMEAVATPVAQPLATPALQQTSQQRRLEVLIALANDPRVSDSTREWAQMWVKTLAS